MRSSIVAGNWKMWGTKASVKELAAGILAKTNEVKGIQLVVFPPFVYLDVIEEHLYRSPIAWGAQNMSAQEPGAYTGEISAQMLKDFSCRYVLLGHSERRRLYHEDDVLISMKFAQAKAHGLTPILCVGETLEERQEGATQAVITKQLEIVLGLNDGVELFREAIIAYEPVWAIGTGLTATPEQAQEIHSFIRQILSKYGEEVAKKVPILYGGSVKLSNARALFAMPDVDGGLIGGASLHADEFIEIAKCIN